jgi:ActR/RegA family two-component response regulator
MIRDEPRRKIATRCDRPKPHRKILERETADAELWGQRAEAAMKRGDEASARSALGQRISALKRVEQYTKEHAIQATEVQKLQDSIRTLQDKIRQAKQKKTLLTARLARASSTNKINAVIDRVDSQSAFAQFSRLEQRVSRKEAVTANDTVKHAVECLRWGATDFLAKPYDVNHVRSIANRSEQRVNSMREAIANAVLLWRSTPLRCRQDLYYRLRGIELVLPPLRQRQEDIPLLAYEFLGRDSRFDRKATAAMLAHTWPGNVRELKQRVESAAAMCDRDTISAVDLGPAASPSTDESIAFETYFGLPLTEARERLVEDFERMAIERAWRETDGNVSAAARRLGIHRQSLQQKISKLEIA